MFLGANSSRPTGSFRQRPKTYKARKVGISDASRQRKQTKLLTDVDHYLTLREPCVASLRSDRHEIGMTDRHHRNAQIGIGPPKGSAGEIQQPWSLTAHNKKVLRGWETLCQQLPENAVRCYEWLRRHPTERIPGRCYELKHKHYAGA